VIMCRGRGEAVADARPGRSGLRNSTGARQEPYSTGRNLKVLKRWNL
jgi:hypothetical protein